MKTMQTMEIAWLIECDDSSGRVSWWRGGRGATSATTDPNQAIRFARQLDAERVLATLDPTWIHARVTEHGWCDPSSIGPIGDADHEA